VKEGKRLEGESWEVGGCEIGSWSGLRLGIEVGVDVMAEKRYGSRC
jgi:hypothetical protein